MAGAIFRYIEYETMTALFKKLNFKAQPEIHILNAPASFAGEFQEMAGVTKVVQSIGKAVSFAIVFATKQKEVDDFAARIAACRQGDAVIWIAYPKGSSKRYKCEFHRDNGFEQMGAHGFEPVRMVAIDEDWSALRFREVNHIKTMTRSSALTEAGKERIKKTPSR
jgi:hypothetical protein